MITPLQPVAVLCFEQVTPDLVAVVDLVSARDLPFTHVADLVWTPRVEPTAAGDVRGVRHVPFEDDAVLGVAPPRNRRQQRLGVRVHRRVEHRLGRAGLDEFAEIHHGDAVTDVLDDREVVADEQVRQPEVLLEVSQQVENLP